MHTITVSIPDRIMTIQDESGAVVRVYSVYVGSERYPTLPGEFSIIDDREIADSDPTYNGLFLPFHEYPDPGADPSLEVEQIAVAGFHGWKYGPEDDAEERQNPGWKTSTEGCVQLTNEDMLEFVSIVAPGDPVFVVDLPLSDIEHLNEKFGL